MNRSQTIAEIAAALSAFQGEVSNPGLSREVTVASQRGNYKFKYAELSEILNVVRPVMAKHGLSLMQSSATVDGRLVVTSLLMHKSGEFIEDSMSSNLPDKAQEVGSLITYLRRYSISGMLGIAGEEDDDANSADGNHIAQSRATPGRSTFGAPPPGAAPRSGPSKEGGVVGGGQVTGRVQAQGKEVQADRGQGGGVESPAGQGVDPWRPATDHGEFFSRFSKCFEVAKLAKDAGKPAYHEFVRQLGESYGFSFRKNTKLPHYESLDMEFLNQSLKDAETWSGV